MWNYFEKWPPKPGIGIVMKAPGPYLSCKISVKLTCFELQKKNGSFKIKKFTYFMRSLFHNVCGCTFLEF